MLFGSAVRSSRFVLRNFDFIFNAASNGIYDDMVKIFEIITSIRGKKKPPDTDFICRKAESLPGLDKEVVSCARDAMVRAHSFSFISFILYIKEGCPSTS